MSYAIYEQIIKEKGVNSAAVSRGTGISQTTFSEWKKGKSTPKADKLKKIADFLNVPLDYLITGIRSEHDTVNMKIQEIQANMEKVKDISDDMRSSINDLLTEKQNLEQQLKEMEYYKSTMTQQAAEDAYHNSRMSILFHAQEGASDEAVRKAAEYLEALKIAEQHRLGND
jgi:transcriptional regulator with XRE-family HTH domain